MIIISEIVRVIWISFPFFSRTINRPRSHIVLMFNYFLRLHKIILFSCVLIMRIYISFVVKAFRVEIDKRWCFFISIWDYFEILIILVGKIDLPVAEEDTYISGLYTLVIFFKFFHQIKYISQFFLLINIVHFLRIIYVNICGIISASYILCIIFFFHIIFLLVPNQYLRNLLSALRHVIALIKIRYFLEKSVRIVFIFIKLTH
jgi:hypothetical protein